MVSRRASLLLAVAALALPGCNEEDTPTLPNVDRSAIAISVTHTPVVATQNAVTAAATTSFSVNLTEVNGLGCEVLYVSAAVFDPATGVQIASNFYDGTDLVVFVGSKRIEPLGTLVVPQTLNYAAPAQGKAATLVVSAQVRDDRANTLNTSLLVAIE